MNAFSVIQKDELMSKIFHILLSIAPFRVLKISDVHILRYLGFQKAIDDMTSGIPLESQTTNNSSTTTTTAASKANLDSSLSAVASSSAFDSSVKAFPKCKYLFFTSFLLH